jgi:hypothetical protein
MISYSGLTSYGKSTLPSVEGAFGSKVIIKDPHKSIHTRKKDKIGSNSDILQEQANSTRIASEYINMYPRGVNQMVSVMYGNGGQQNGVITTNQLQPKLPYNLGTGGFAFRPPIQTPFDLLPLSRLPRKSTFASSNPEMRDFSKKMYDYENKELKEIIKNMIITPVTPTCVYKIETPISEPFEIKYTIKNPVKTSAENKPIGTNEKLPEISLSEKYIDRNIKVINTGQLNKSDTTVFVKNSFLPDTSGYIQDKLHSNIQSSQTKLKPQEYINKDIQLNRIIPQHSITTNAFDKNVNKINNTNNKIITTRNTPLTNIQNNTIIPKNVKFDEIVFKLPKKIEVGGYGGQVKQEFIKQDINVKLKKVK